MSLAGNPHLHRVGRDVATDSLVPGQIVYGERTVGNQRIWNPRRSKLAAALLKGLRINLPENLDVLYLGVSSGTTASHVSDLLRSGHIIGVDVAPRVLREFVLLAETRQNLIPLLADASQPGKYAFLVPPVDLIYQDVAQRQQAQILIRNARFLKKGGLALLMIKARSIDVRKDPREVFEGEVRQLREAGFKILQQMRLEPFERDHLAVLAQWG